MTIYTFMSPGNKTQMRETDINTKTHKAWICLVSLEFRRSCCDKSDQAQSVLLAALTAHSQLKMKCSVRDCSWKTHKVITANGCVWFSICTWRERDEGDKRDVTAAKERRNKWTFYLPLNESTLHSSYLLTWSMRGCVRTGKGQDVSLLLVVLLMHREGALIPPMINPLAYIACIH